MNVVAAKDKTKLANEIDPKIYPFYKHSHYLHKMCIDMFIFSN